MKRPCRAAGLGLTPGAREGKFPADCPVSRTSPSIDPRRSPGTPRPTPCGGTSRRLQDSATSGPSRSRAVSPRREPQRTGGVGGRPADVRRGQANQGSAREGRPARRAGSRTNPGRSRAGVRPDQPPRARPRVVRVHPRLRVRAGVAALMLTLTTASRGQVAPATEPTPPQASDPIDLAAGRPPSTSGIRQAHAWVHLEGRAAVLQGVEEVRRPRKPSPASSPGQGRQARSTASTCTRRDPPGPDERNPPRRLRASFTTDREVNVPWCAKGGLMRLATPPAGVAVVTWQPRAWRRQPLELRAEGSPVRRGPRRQRASRPTAFHRPPTRPPPATAAGSSQPLVDAAAGQPPEPAVAAMAPIRPVVVLPLVGATPSPAADAPATPLHVASFQSDSSDRASAATQPAPSDPEVQQAQFRDDGRRTSTTRRAWAATSTHRLRATPPRSTVPRPCRPCQAAMPRRPPSSRSRRRAQGRPDEAPQRCQHTGGTGDGADLAGFRAIHPDLPA